MYLRGKYPTKSEKELTDMVTSRITSKINEDEWMYIIKNLYNENDSATLCEQVYVTIDGQQQGMY